MAADPYQNPVKRSEQDLANQSFNYDYNIAIQGNYGYDVDTDSFVPFAVNTDGTPRDETILGETPVGALDGVNVTYTTYFNYKPLTTQVYLNGLRQREGMSYDYYEATADTIIFNAPPISSDTILMNYIKG